MKKQIILVLGLLIAGALPAQEKGSYINLTVGGGYHNLSYSLLNGTVQKQTGYTLDAGYSYFFTPYWGIHTGLGIQTFNSQSTLNYLSNTPDVDTDGQTYDFKANYTNFQEKQQAILIDIPLAVQYRFPVSTKFTLQASVGAKVALPIQSTFKTTGGQLVTTGYYSLWNVELSDMPQHGFGSMTSTFSGNTTLKPAYMGIADLGGLVKLSQRLDLYVGGYINYGLNNVLTPDSKLIYQPNGKYNGIFASSQTDHVTPISFGVKIGVYFHLGKHTTLNDIDNAGNSSESELSKEQLNINESSNTTTSGDSKKVVVEEVVTQQSTKENNQNNRGNLSNATITSGNSTVITPLSSSTGNGKNNPVQPKTLTGTTAGLNNAQLIDSLNRAGSVNSKTVNTNGHTANQPLNGTKQNNTSSRSGLPVSEGNPLGVLPVSSLNGGGGKNSTLQPETTTGITGRLHHGQPADSLNTTGSLNSKAVSANGHTANQPLNGTKLSNTTIRSGLPVPAGNPLVVLPVSSLNGGGGKNRSLQPKTATGNTGRLDHGQPADSLNTTGSLNSKAVSANGHTANQLSNGTKLSNTTSLSNPSLPSGNPVGVLSVSSSNSGGKESAVQPKATTGSVNPEYVAVNGGGAKHAPKGIFGFFTSIFSTSSHSKGKLTQEQPVVSSNPTDSVRTTNSVRPTNVALKAGTPKQAPMGKRKYLKNILSKSSGQKGKNNSIVPSDSFDPSGSINSARVADSLNNNNRFNSGQVTSPFERAKKIASSMSQWFDFDSYEITDANNLNTKELSDILKANPDILLIFVGYTCNIGTQVTNIKLGMKRVESVIQKFLDQGVPESQLIGESKGYDQPLVPNTSAENRALNRRVEIKVIKDN